MKDLIHVLFEQIKKGNIDKTQGSRLIKMVLQHKNEREGIAIIGMAGRFPDANSTDELWEIVKKKKDCISTLPLFREWDCIDMHAKLNPLNSCEFGKGGYLREIDKFDYSFFGITPHEAMYMDPSQRLFLEVAFHALEDAGYTGNSRKEELVGVYVGYSTWPIYAKLLSAEQVDEYSDAFTGGLSSMIPARLSYYLNLKGPATLIDTACSSSLSAVHIACNALYSNDCTMAVAGGVNIRMLPYKMASQYGIDASDSKTKAFDEAADGTTWGEGVAVICLKKLQNAIQDGDNIYAVIWGSAMNHDGHTASITTPNIESQVNIQCHAWDEAGINPENISLLEAHGTGTFLGDTIEIEAINRAMRKYTNSKQFCAIGSLKTNIGHLDGASGIAGIIKLIYSLQNRALPPTLHLELPNQKVDYVDSPVYINTKLQEWEDTKYYCAISSFGISGTNCYAILGNAPEISSPLEVNQNNSFINILVVSAKSNIALQKLIFSYYDFIKKDLNNRIDDICYSAAIGREHYQYRFAIILHSRTDLLDKLKKTCLAFEQKNNIPAECYIYSQTDKRNEKDLHKQEVLISFRNNQKFASEICERYCRGEMIDWRLFYPNGKIVSIPLYPFDKIRCWYPMEQKKYENYLFKTKWRDFEISDKIKRKNLENYLIFYTSYSACKLNVGMELQKKSHSIKEIMISDEVFLESDEKIVIRNTEEDFLGIYNKYPNYNKILFVNHEEAIESDYVQLKNKIQNNLCAFLNCLKALSKREQSTKIDIYLLCNGVNDVISDNEIYPINAALAGMGKAFNTENTLSQCHCIDYDPLTLPEEIMDAVLCEHTKYQIALRQHKYYAEYIQKLFIDEYDYQQVSIKSQGVYIITGGFGGIGIEISRYLSSLSKVNLVFFNRSEVPPEEQWDMILELGQNQSMCRKLRVAKEILKLGSAIYCYQVDVSEQRQLAEALNRVRKRFGKINGVIHSAGIAGNGLIIKKNFKEFERIIRPKIYGTWLLDYLTRKDNLDFFLLFSSGVSIFGDPGHCDYMAANAYLDAYEAYRNRLGLKTVTINWTGWKEIGMSVDLGVNVDATFKQILTTDALRCFHYIFHHNVHRVLIGEFNSQSEILRHLDEKRIPFYVSAEVEKYLTEQFDVKQVVNDRREKGEDFVLCGRESGEFTKLEREVGEVWHNILGYSQISVLDNFFELGGDSIKAVQMMLRINYLVNNEDIYQYPVLEEFCKLIENRQFNNTENFTDRAISAKKQYYYPELPNFQLIDGIVPYNGVYFKDCFYNAFFTALSFFGCDITPFLINEVIIYKFIRKEVGKLLKPQYISVESMDVLIKNSSVSVDVPKKTEDMLKELLNYVSRGYLVIIRIDCYYEPFRKDTYQQVHWSHAVLVYGYDIEKRKLMIYEHENINSLIYKQVSMSFDDLLLCWDGYVKNFYEKEKVPILIAITKKEEGEYNLSGNEYQNRYFYNLYKYQVEIQESINEFDSFIRYVGWILEQSKTNVDELYYNVVQIIKAKQSEIMIFDALDTSIFFKLKEIGNKIISQYQYIARQLGRYKAIQRLEEERKNKIIENMVNISNLQKVYYEILFMKEKV